MSKTPQLVNGSWTCPPGYAFGKCYGCGHNHNDDAERTAALLPSQLTGS